MTTPDIPSPSIETEQQRIKQLMARTLDMVELNDQHCLELKGVQPDLRTIRDLETHFGYTLEGNTGSSLTINYNERSHRFTLDELSLPIQGMDGSVLLKRTNMPNASFMPLVRMGDTYSEAPKQAWEAAWQTRLSTTMLAGHGIDFQPPRNAPREVYRAWLADVALTKARSWRLHEEAQILSQKVYSKSLGTVTGVASIARDQFVPEEAAMSTESLSIIYDIKELTTDDEIKVHRQALEIANHQDESRMICSSQTLLEVPSIDNDGESVLVPYSGVVFRAANEDDLYKYSYIMESARYPVVD